MILIKSEEILQSYRKIGITRPRREDDQIWIPPVKRTMAEKQQERKQKASNK